MPVKINESLFETSEVKRTDIYRSLGCGHFEITIVQARVRFGLDTKLKRKTADKLHIKVIKGILYINGKETGI